MKKHEILIHLQMNLIYQPIESIGIAHMITKQYLKKYLPFA